MKLFYLGQTDKSVSGNVFLPSKMSYCLPLQLIEQNFAYSHD